MFKIPLAVWIANAAACLTGVYGDVTHQAEAADCSRQTVYDHAHKVQAAVEAEHAGGPTRAELIQENQHLRQENARLWDWLAQTVEFPPAQQREFTVTATAMRLSLNQVLVLLALVLGAQACPGRSTIQRWIKAAGQAAGRVLKHLDGRCQALVLVGCLDEIVFHRCPVLVGVEPTSMVWFLGRKVDDRTGATWSKALHDLDRRFRTSWRMRGRVCKRGSRPCHSSGRRTTSPRWRTAWMCSTRRQEAPTGLTPELEPCGTPLGAGRSGQPPGRAGAAAGPGCAGRGGGGPSGLDEGGGRVPAVRAIRSGLDDRPRGAAACFVPMVS